MRLWNDCVKKPTGALDSFQHLLVVKLVALRRQGDLFQSIELGAPSPCRARCDHGRAREKLPLPSLCGSTVIQLGWI